MVVVRMQRHHRGKPLDASFLQAAFDNLTIRLDPDSQGDLKESTRAREETIRHQAGFAIAEQQSGDAQKTDRQAPFPRALRRQWCQVSAISFE